MSNNNSNSNAHQIPRLPIFVGYYYEQWVERMKTIFIGYGLWEYVENGYDESNEKMKEENIKNDAKALFYIKLALSPPIRQRLMHVAKAKQAWDILIKDFKGNPQVPPPNSGHNLAPPPPSIPIMDRPPQYSRFPPGSKRAKALAALYEAGQGSSIGRKVCKEVIRISRQSQLSHGNNLNGTGPGSASDHAGGHFHDLSSSGMASTGDYQGCDGNTDLFAYAYDIGSNVDFTQFQDCAGNDLFVTTHDVIGSVLSDNNVSQFQDCGCNDDIATADSVSQFQDYPAGSDDLVVVGTTEDATGSSGVDNVSQFEDCGGNNDDDLSTSVEDVGSSVTDHISQLEDYGSGSSVSSIFAAISDMF